MVNSSKHVTAVMAVQAGLMVLMGLTVPVLVARTRSTGWSKLCLTAHGSQQASHGMTCPILVI